MIQYKNSVKNNKVTDDENYLNSSFIISFQDYLEYLTVNIKYVKNLFKSIKITQSLPFFCIITSESI